MNIKTLIIVLSIGLFTISTIVAQDKKPSEVTKLQDSIKRKHSVMKMDHSKMNMKHDSMKMDHSKMNMKHDSVKMDHSMMNMKHASMKMDHSKMNMKQDSMKMDHSKMKMKHDSIKMGHSMMKHLEKGKIFVCPMHPEVESEKPGQCPKCGMKLEGKIKDKEMGKNKIKNAPNKKHNH